MALISRARNRLHRERSSHWFVSFPKCGRTWSKTIIESYLARKLETRPFTFEGFDPWIRRGAERGIPRMSFIHPHCRDIDPEPSLAFMRKIERRKIVFLVRDPRMVVFTYYFRLVKRMEDPLALSLSISEFVRHPEVGIDRVVAFMNLWYENRDRFRGFQLLKLESIRAEPEKELGDCLRFIGHEPDQALLAEVISSTPDVTTRTIEDDSVEWSADDRFYMERAMEALHPALGYRPVPAGPPEPTKFEAEKD